jgi:hypothetical protein
VANRIRIIAQLNDAEKKEIIKSFPLDGKAEDILDLTNSLSKMVRDFLVISKLDMERGKEYTEDVNFKVSTSSPEAYMNIIIGNDAPDNLTAINYYRKAIALDSNFVLPYLYITRIYKNIGGWGNIAAYDSAKKWCLKIYKKLTRFL